MLEYVGGGTLDERLSKQASLPVVEATRAIIDACKGVGAAHAAGLIHRDIKPANLMQTGDGSIKVADFGLAKAGADSNRTQPGTVVGTPFFMSPEQCEARPLDPRSDIYALGATYYTLLTGTKPYQETESVTQLMYLHCHGPIPDPRSIDSSIPEACARIVAKAMAKVPARVINPPRRCWPICKRSWPPFPPLSFRAIAAAFRRNLLIPARRCQAVPRRSSLQAPARQPAPKGRRAGLVWAAIAMGGLAVGIGAVLWLTGFFGRRADKGQAPLAPAGASGEIVLGMTAPFSGPSNELGREMEIGIRTYLSHVNDEGGVAGRKIRLVALDDGYEPDRARANMEELYSKHKVFAVIGNVGTPTAEKTVPFALEKQLIYFGGFSGAPLLRRDPPDRFVFNYRASYEEETAAICKYFVDIKRIRPEHIAVFAQQDGYGDAGMRGVTKMLRKYGADPDKILRVGHPRNAFAGDDAIQQIVNNPDIAAVVMVSTYRPAAPFIHKVKEGRKAKGANKDLLFANVSFVGSNALADELRQRGPTFAEGVILSQVVPSIDSQATAVIRYRELLAKYYPNTKPNFVSLEGYIDAVLLIEGMKRSGNELTTDSLVDGLQSIRALDLGIGAPLTFGPSEHQASHKVWGTVLDGAGNYQVLEMD